jgi:hypothetical protein
VKNAKASGNQAMVRKIWTPGFIFVLTGAISAFRNGAVREKTTRPLSFRSQVYRRGICLPPAAKQQIPHGTNRASE